jgi:hypothetical protein
VARLAEAPEVGVVVGPAATAAHDVVDLGGADVEPALEVEAAPRLELEVLEADPAPGRVVAAAARTRPGGVHVGSPVSLIVALLDELVTERALAERHLAAADQRPYHRPSRACRKERGMSVFGSWLRRRLWQMAIIVALIALFAVIGLSLRTGG